MKIFKAISHHDHATKQTNPSISLSDMVDNIIRKDSFYEGSSHLIIDKIVSLKNSTNADGMKEITEAWGKVNEANEKAKYKINKYFNKGIEASKNYFLYPPKQSLPTKEIQSEQKEDGFEKSIVRKSHSDDLSNNSMPIKSNSESDRIIEKMEYCNGVITKQKNEVVSEEIKKIKLNQLGKSEEEPKSQKILSRHTIEEAIRIKVIFNGISNKSLNLIKAKIKEKFNKLKSSETPELFEREMLSAQGILKEYDNELVCKKINEIINQYLDEHELYIRENRSPINRIWCAINSVFGLQDVTPRKLNEFKMAIIDGLKMEPVENIDKYKSDLRRKISNYTHENIAKQINDFIDVYSVDRVNELKGNEKFSVVSKTELLEPEKNRDPEEIMKDMSLKKIISHVFNRIINKIRRIFS
ncbi:TPA: hypothetical protein KEY68_000439 [Providencia rettgeri]|uniref:hypothetical protein n=1 Tax=Providencia sp. PROV141 TaxID=2949851 RepID=UPI001B8FDD61|nr:hypothetical protein [Providencia sp. PROV141]HBC7428210.1 hypothetical protein [Providencia rettgeri]